MKKTYVLVCLMLILPIAGMELDQTTQNAPGGPSDKNREGGSSKKLNWAEEIWNNYATQKEQEKQEETTRPPLTRTESRTLEQNQFTGENSLPDILGSDSGLLGSNSSDEVIDPATPPSTPTRCSSLSEEVILDLSSDLVSSQSTKVGVSGQSAVDLKQRETKEDDFENMLNPTQNPEQTNNQRRPLQDTKKRESGHGRRRDRICTFLNNVKESEKEQTDKAVCENLKNKDTVRRKLGISYSGLIRLGILGGITATAAASYNHHVACHAQGKRSIFDTLWIKAKRLLRAGTRLFLHTEQKAD